MKASEKQVGGDHYKKLAIQPMEFCQRNGLNYCESSVIRYVTRHREKNGRQDIEKAIHYLQLLLEWEYPDAPIDPPACSHPPRDPGPDAGGLYRDRPVCAACEEE